MLSASCCAYLPCEQSCLIRLSTGVEGLRLGSWASWEAERLWQPGTVFPEWAQISYFNAGDATFLLIVSVISQVLCPQLYYIYV